MDVQTIAQQSGLSLRKIRYVLEQRLLPGLRCRVQKNLAGQPRLFTPMEGFAIALVALLLEGGTKRETVSRLIDRLIEIPWPPPGMTQPAPRRRQRPTPKPCTALEALYKAREQPSLVLMGDGVNLRLRLGSLDTGWFEPQSLARLDGTYRPAVVIQLDLAPLLVRFGSACPP